MPQTKAHRELGTGRWKKLRIEILKRDGYICWICGGDGADSVDHLISRHDGGNIWDRDNLAAAHKICNSRKGKKNAFFSGNTPTPPAFRFKNSPKGANQSKIVQNGHTTVRIDPDSPFMLPDQSGAN